MTAGVPALTALLDELDRMVPEAGRGFMEDRAPEAAGFFVDAVPRLTAAVRAALDLADELTESTEALDRMADDARQRYDLMSEGAYLLQRSNLAAVADRLRSALTAALEATPPAEERRCVHGRYRIDPCLGCGRRYEGGQLVGPFDQGLSFEATP